MKYKNVMKKYQSIELQLFADEGGEAGDNGDDSGEGDDQDDDESDEDGDEEKKFSQRDVDEAVKKRLERVAMLLGDSTKTVYEMYYSMSQKSKEDIAENVNDIFNQFDF